MQPFAVNIFAAMSALAARLEAVNLGQGFPDEDGPPAMLEAAQQAIAHGVNQYPPGPGILALRQAIAAQRRRAYGMLEFDPETGCWSPSARPRPSPPRCWDWSNRART